MSEQWPELKRDWTGRRVRLLRTLKTVGGNKFRKGSIMTIEDYYRGMRLHGRNGSITRVNCHDVELLSAHAKDQP